MPSSGFTVRATELAALAADLASAAGRSDTIARNVQEKYGRLVVREAKRLAPVDTGALKRSIQFEESGEAGRSGLRGVTISADTSEETGREYSGYVEFGTAHQPPQPFMRPALRKYARAYREELVDEAAKLIGTKRATLAAIKGQSVYRGPSSLSLGTALGRI